MSDTLTRTIVLKVILDEYLYFLCTIASEIIVIVVTWLNTKQQMRVARQLGMTDFPLTTCVVRNGSLYFVATTFMSIIGLVGQISHVPGLGQFTLLAQYMPAIMANRFIINLRKIDQVESMTYPSLHISGIQFQGGSRSISSADESYQLEDLAHRN
ncbi:hypothetical protein PHLGIDRAFT_400897 [Phlebiopsis gigantea 11061_1 CR5-6]|uniref:Uncharacterized protein n=1 Tax=Phlebiopsis gigantea (strain 11061_1 CR5-6) TaxID=745531 RepID=A0A0C3RZS8_PHLG1|nr:hypothetical protein PHLGIDRAFT_400897 [Phlebiopsis gigantea 11061_1 CR5-6]